MKKIFTLFAGLMAAATLSAQTVLESKTFDNVYIGINGGLAATSLLCLAWQLRATFISRIPTATPQVRSLTA